MDFTILIQLFLAHVIADFILQPNHWVEQKKQKLIKSPYFWLHIGIVTFLSYLFVGDWDDWMIPLTIFVTHGIIDFTKLRLDRLKIVGSMTLFSLDQIAHLLVIIAIWLYTQQNVGDFSLNISSENIQIMWIMTTAIITLTTPIGIVIGKFVEPFRKKVAPTDSLKNAGKYIGIFERLLIFIFILLNQYSAIGFLLASKSILRISKDSDKNARKKTEYVLVGTLISFFSAIVISLITKYLIGI
ncbi:MAG: DUF3307 domain-containing protein [Weeksellaceae bacterium]